VNHFGFVLNFRRRMQSIDEIVVVTLYKQTNGKPCIIFMGRAQVAANSPIKIKKHVRAPGNRKMIKSFNKMGCHKLRMTNENRSSRLCGRCYTPFELRTLSHRFKECEWCLPDNDKWPDGLKLPRKIVTMKSKRMLRSERRAVRNALVEDPNEAVGFVSKVMCYRKNWQQNAANPGINNNNNAEDDEECDDDVEGDDDVPVLKTIWHRDISAAKLILYRGT
jgi:hypothetical protein